MGHPMLDWIPSILLYYGNVINFIFNSNSAQLLTIAVLWKSLHRLTAKMEKILIENQWEKINESR